MKTGGLVLAAGLSSRMGFFKPLADINGKKMIAWTVDSMFQGGVNDIVVVTGHNHEELEQYLAEQYVSHVTAVFNPDYANGNMFSSVKSGLLELKNVDAFYLLLADMPAVAAETFYILKNRMLQTEKKIILPVSDGRRRHPPFVAGEMIGTILGYEGEGGLRGFWQSVLSDIEHVEVDDIGCTLDTDTPEQLDTMRQYLRCMSEKTVL